MASQPGGLRLVDHGAQPGRLARAADRAEIDVDRDVLRAGCREGIAALAAAEVRAQPRHPAEVALGPRLAVVEDVQRSPCEQRGEPGLQLGLRGRDLQLGALGRLGAAPANDRPQVGGRRASRVSRRSARPSPTETSSSSGQRSTWAGTASCTSFAIRTPVIGSSSSSVTCRACGSRARCSAARPAERSHSTSSSGRSRERVGEARGERAVTRADLADGERIRAAERLPRAAQIGRERPREQWNERRHRRERAPASDPRPARVEAVGGVVERRLHERGEGDRPLGRDPVAQPVAEPAQGVKSSRRERLHGREGLHGVKV